MKKSELFFSLLLLPVDAAMILFSFIIAFYLRIKTDIIPVHSATTFREYFWFVIYIIPFWLLIFALSGLYKISRERNYFNDLYKIFVSNSVAILVFIVAIFFGRAFFFSRLILILILLISVVFVFFGRVIVTQIQRYLYQFGYGIHKIIVIGNNSVAIEISKEIDSVKRLGMKFVGVVNGLGVKEFKAKEEKVLGELSDLRQIISKYRPDEVILTDISINRDKILEIIEICSDEKISFKFVSDVFSIVTTKTKSTVLAGYPMMELNTVVLDGWGRIVKRIFDLISSTIIMLLLSPFYLLVAIAVKITSEGPVIYRQKRVGRDGQVFDFYKFRSMYSDKCDTSARGKKWSTKADLKNRITPVGRFIRKTNLDELPQFWNVLIGNMSFVGPRPELPNFVDKFQKEIPDYFRRHRVKSGITGWAQINGLKGDTSISERVRFDIFYIENWSFGFDLKIIIKTIFLIIGESFGGKYEYRNRS